MHAMRESRSPITMAEEHFDPFGLSDEKFAPPLAPPSVTEGQDKSTQEPAIVESLSMDSFDPFGIRALQQQQPPQKRKEDKEKATGALLSPPPKVSRVTRPTHKSVALPPKVMVKLTLHEEVSSVAKLGHEMEGTSEVSVEGSIYAQLQCSDAKKNAPFVLRPANSQLNKLQLRTNKAYSDDGASTSPVIKIPKHEIGYVPVAYYSTTDEVEHMPILLERKVTLHNTSCRIAIQVRSKLTNLADMTEFTIAVAVPERVDASTVEIVRGNGVWDDLKRTIKWKLASLEKGASFMVSAQCKLWKELGDDEDLRFPVLLRCISTADQISNVEFEAAEVQGHPASVTYSSASSFRLLHRLT